MDRTYGGAPSGVRVDGPVPHGHWKITTLTAAVRLDGVPPSACLAFDGATDSSCFETYVGQCLAPTLRPGDIVVMDNLTCHKTAEVGRLIAAAGAEVRYLPASSATSTLNIGVIEPLEFRDTPRHKEVSHEQKVYRPAVG
jgi:hypothetical protein